MTILNNTCPKFYFQGDTQKIDAYRLEESIKRTKIRRPRFARKVGVYMYKVKTNNKASKKITN